MIHKISFDSKIKHKPRPVDDSTGCRNHPMENKNVAPPRLRKWKSSNPIQLENPIAQIVPKENSKIHHAKPRFRGGSVTGKYSTKIYENVSKFWETLIEDC